MPLKLAEIVDLIVTKSGKSKDKVLKLIEAKKKELNGYVTDEGAASLVARELDLDLFERQPTPELKLSIRDLVVGMTGVSLNLKVIRIFPVRTFTRKQGGEGKVANLTGADSTGSIRVTFWDKHTQPIEDQEIDEGDIVRIINGRVRTGLRDQLEIHLGSGSRIMVNPPDVDSKDFPDVIISQINISSLEEGMNDVQLEGSVTTKFRKTTFSREDSEGVVASLLLADESGRTRLVLWDEQTEWFDKLNIDDRIRVESGYVRLNRNSEVELHLGRRGRITLLEPTTGKPSPKKPEKHQLLKDLRPGDYAQTVGVIVQANEGVSTFTRKDGREGKRLVLSLADKTGQVRAVAWGQAAENLATVEVGTLLQLQGVGCRVGLRQELELHINESTQVKQNPKGLAIQSPSETLLLVEKLAPSLQAIADVTEGNFVTLRGTIVQVIHQRSIYDACPKCSRKVSISGKTITCSKCGSIPESIPRLIAKIVIDDGTENIRASFIGNSAESLFGMDGTKAKTLIQDTGNENALVDRVEETLLGKEVTISGRISLNNFSNELEMSVNKMSEANPLDVANQMIKDLERKVQR